MATTPKTSTEKLVTEIVEETNKAVPSQRAKVEVKEGAIIVTDENKPTFRDKIKNVVKNKKVIAGASTVALLAAGILVARKRSTGDTGPENETQSS
jgi:hypothetical protein